MKYIHIEKEVFEDLIEKELSLKKISKIVGLSTQTVSDRLAKLGLKTKFRTPSKVCNCRFCGELDSNRFYPLVKSICKKCSFSLRAKTNQLTKSQVVEYMGGKCSICGYNKCNAALDLHHKNPRDKDPKFGSLRTMTFENQKAELEKCILVCSNCHREIHFNIDNKIINARLRK